MIVRAGFARPGRTEIEVKSHFVVWLVIVGGSWVVMTR